MKIKVNKDIEAFFERCEYNMQNNMINDYIGCFFESSQEKELQEELADIGVHEFLKPRSEWPSLYINTDEYVKTPYNSTIKLENINSDGFTYNLEMMPPNELFNVGSVIFDQNKELNDSLILRAFDKPFPTAILKQGDEFWMSDTPAEANTINPCAKKAHGNVLTFGLGIGYFVYMALLNTNVSSITIIEKSEAVIKMFKKHLLPQFPRHDLITIIHQDAFDYFKKETIEQYDYVFVDIWKSCDDGLVIIEKMLENYLPPNDKVDFWIEAACFEIMPAMIFVYFYYLWQNEAIDHENENYKRIYKKIDVYFSAIDETISDVEKLKDYMYNFEIFRAIISINL